jgi:hypothetical protein
MGISNTHKAGKIVLMSRLDLMFRGKKIDFS